MTLFGRQIEAQEIAALVFMLMALVLWLGALRDTRSYKRWFRGWEAERKARRDAERRALGEDVPDDGAPPPKGKSHGGPWG